MAHIEAMKLALEALELARTCIEIDSIDIEAEQAVEALKDAIEYAESEQPVAYITNKRQRINIEFRPNTYLWQSTSIDWEMPLYTRPQLEQDEVDIRSRLYQRIHELEDLLRDIAEYDGEGQPTTDYRAIVKSISLSARSALGEEI